MLFADDFRGSKTKWLFAHAEEECNLYTSMLSRDGVFLMMTFLR